MMALLGAAALSLSCRPGANLATLDARTLRVPVAADESAPIQATYFPATVPRGERRKVPLVVVEPLLFRRELLYAGPGPSGGLIAYLQSEGFPIWLIWSAAPPASARAFGRGIAEGIESIARATGARRFDLLGLSLGAEATLRALDPLTAPGSGVEIRRVAFLGGGFDFAYPASFASRVASIRGGSATALCTLDGDVDCAREFRKSDAAAGWLASLPPADDDALAPSRERFAFVARLTRVPVLFINGKADGIAPSESMFPLYTLWGSEEPQASTVPKLLFLAGRENALGWDFDHFELFGSDRAEGVWARVAAWLGRGDWAARGAGDHAGDEPGTHALRASGPSLSSPE
jgi:pimeloyl-ACP methyl ester carboxylesterase